ncbi:MAG: fructosamine kinase, partial [Alphaproteobacteria bacterium]
LRGRIERLAERLEELVAEPAHPALLHGDIWSGNLRVGEGRIHGLIDPAIYAGHPEIELAFLTMFGTAGAPFFDAYAALRPEFDRRGFAERRPLYLIYPHLTHVMIEGPGWARPLAALLDRLGA